MVRRHFAHLCFLSAGLLSAVSSCSGAVHDEHKKLGAAGLAGAGLAGTGATESPPPSAPVFATWLWEPAPIVDEAQRDAFFAFAQREKISDAFVHAASRYEDPEPFSRLATFVEQAGKRHIAVTLTAGDPAWALDEQHDRALQKLEVARRLRNELKARGVLWKARVQFDIEPYTLPAWKSERADLIEGYVRLLTALRERASSEDIELWFAVPHWFDRQPAAEEGRTLLDAVLAQSDGIVVMAYRNEPGSISNLVEEELRAAAAQNRRVVVAVEAKCVKPGQITFCGLKAAALQESLRIVDAQLGSSAAFRGLAVHDYEAFRALGRTEAVATTTEP